MIIRLFLLIIKQTNFNAINEKALVLFVFVKPQDPFRFMLVSPCLTKSETPNENTLNHSINNPYFLLTLKTQVTMKTISLPQFHKMLHLTLQMKLQLMKRF